MTGYFSIGVYNPKHDVNIGTLWRSAYSLGASFIFTCGSRQYKKQSSDTVKAWRHIPLFHFPKIDDLVNHLPYNCPLIGIELAPWADKIKDFRHPERVCYLLGAEDNGLPGQVITRCHKLVQLPGEYCLNVSVAGSIVMFDRNQKNQNQ